MKLHKYPTLVLLLGLLCIEGCRSANIPVPTSRPPAQESAHPRREPERDRGSRSGASTNDSSFDYYLLNLSWSPEFCHNHQQAPECAMHLGFTLHGLWPQRYDGSYPEHCSDAPGPQYPAKYKDIYPDAHLLQHEWQTHGTCSGLDAATFFGDARSAVHELRIPQQLLASDRQQSMPPVDILALFVQSNPDLPRNSLVISCGNNYLTAVAECLDRSLHPIACGRVRSCRANTIRIAPINR